MTRNPRERSTEMIIRIVCAGAPVGQAIGDDCGRTAATLIGAAVGAQIGASQPRHESCRYRDQQTGQTYRAACP